MKKVIFVITLVLLMTCAQAGPPILVDPDTGKYLGNLNRNALDPDSVYNSIGRYGSSVSPDSINNPVGKYGSTVSPHSPNNPLNRSSVYDSIERDLRVINREYNLDPSSRYDRYDPYYRY